VVCRQGSTLMQSLTYSSGATWFVGASFKFKCELCWSVAHLAFSQCWCVVEGHRRCTRATASARCGWERVGACCGIYSFEVMEWGCVWWWCGVPLLLSSLHQANGPWSYLDVGSPRTRSSYMLCLVLSLSPSLLFQCWVVPSTWLTSRPSSLPHIHDPLPHKHGAHS
jgi:hypothetical protein